MVYGVSNSPRSAIVYMDCLIRNTCDAGRKVGICIIIYNLEYM